MCLLVSQRLNRSRAEARLAGYQPKNSPTPLDTSTDAITELLVTMSFVNESYESGGRYNS